MSTISLYGDTSGYVNITVPLTIAVPWTVTLPSAAPTANGQYLSSTTAGVTSWSSLGPATYATIVGYTTTVTSASPVTLTSSSTFYQFFTGSTAQTVVLPVTSTLATGWTFNIVNNSTANITVNSSGSNLVATCLPGTTLRLICILTSGTTAASWDSEVVGFTTVTGTGNNVLATAPTITNPTITDYIETYFNIGTVTTSASPTLSNGTVQTLTLTASTTCTVTMPTATAGKSFILLVRQAASTGNGAVTWSSVKWNSGGTPTVTATAGRMDIFTFVADGTNWYGSASQGYTP
jgi:hypothetical protein